MSAAGQHFGEVKSAPLIEASTILSKESNDSNSSTISYKSCGALDDIHWNDNMDFDGRMSVKALAQKFNKNYTSSELFESSKTSKENNYCGHSGDRAKSVELNDKILSDTDGDFVKRGVEILNDSDKNITLWEQKSGVIELDSRDDQVWQRIVDVVQANRIYHRCLKSIADASVFQKVGDVAKYADSVLESVGQVACEEGYWAQDWADGCAGQVSDGHSKGGHTLEKRPSYGVYYRLESVENELKNSRNTVKKLETRMAVLQRDKRDLMNILKGYETENVHKLSLEKRLKAEQSKNDQLRAMISSVFDEKIRSL